MDDGWGVTRESPGYNTRPAVLGWWAGVGHGVFFFYLG